MYVDEAVPDLVTSLTRLASSSSEVLIAHGRNTSAEQTFAKAIAKTFSMQLLSEEELDDVYQCSDVDVWRLQKFNDSN